MTFKRNRRYATFVQDLSEFNECCEERDAEISAAEKDAIQRMAKAKSWGGCDPLAWKIERLRLQTNC